MADPLSITAGLVSVAAGGIALASRLHDLVDRFGGALAEIESIASELNYFAIVLDELSKILNVPAPQQIASDRLISSIRDIMEKCKFVFKEINKMITKANGAKKGGLAHFNTKVKWVFRDARVRSVRVTLESLKATLGLMLQTLRLAKNDESDQMQRAILKNMLKIQENSVKVLQSMDKEEAKPTTLHGGSGIDTPQLPGIPVQEKSSNAVGMTRSTSVLLSSAVPHFRRRKTSQSKPVEDADPTPLYSVPTSQDSSGYDLPNSTTSARYSASPIHHPPAADYQYDSTEWGQTQTVYPPMSDNYGSGGEGMSIGIPAPVLQKSDIDLLLSNWVHRPGLQSQTHDTYSQPYGRVPEVTLDSDSRPSFASEEHSDYQTPYDTETYVSEGLGVPRGTSINSIQNMKKIQDLKEKRDAIHEGLHQYKANAERLRNETRDRSAKESELLLETNIRARETDDDKQSFEIEKNLMHCEAEQENQTSILQELQRCREDYATRMLEQPFQSHEILRRHIQNMEERLGKKWFGESSLSDVRKDLLNRLKAIQAEHEISIAGFQAEHDARLEEIEKTECSPDESQKVLERSLAVVVLELTKLEDGLRRTWEARTSQSSDTVPRGYKDPILDAAQYPKTSNTFRAPD